MNGTVPFLNMGRLGGFASSCWTRRKVLSVIGIGFAVSMVSGSPTANAGTEKFGVSSPRTPKRNFESSTDGE
jgi:hypothetical protein